MDEQRSQQSFFVHEQNLELNVRFETYFATATATAEFEKSTSKKNCVFHAFRLLDSSNSIP